MKRIATPMVGGVVTSTIMELLVYPAIYYLWRSHKPEKLAANWARCYSAVEGHLNHRNVGTCACMHSWPLR